MADVFSDLQRQIEQDVAQLHAVWQLYRSIFAVDEPTIGLLNETAAFCFRTIQDSLMDAVVLHVARLCDKPTVCGKDTLVLKRLIDNLPDAQANLKSILQDRYQGVVELADALLEHRHNRIAHTNLEFAMGRSTLPGISRAMVEDALRAIREFVKVLHPEMHFDRVLVIGGGNALISALRLASKFSELQMESWAGRITAARLQEEIRKGIAVSDTR